MDKAVIILAGGNGSRLNLGYNKLLFEINNEPIYMKTLKAFEGYKIYFVSNDIKPSNVVQIEAGATRFLSVYNALKVVKEEYVLIHDCARCFITKDIIDKCNGDLFYVGVKAKDTIRIGNTTPKRDDCIIVQTPQGGLTKYFKEAYEKAYQNNKEYTDDISVVLDYFNITPIVIEGSYENIKVTTIDDIKPYMNYKIGHSFDVHRLAPNRPLILGGVNIPYKEGLLGHSDGDALYHAVAESILGALALGDLGKLFPDNDPNTLGIDSKIIVNKCVELMVENNYEINNIDIMIYAEKPKMAPFILEMRKNLSNILHTDISNISVKATTYERLGEIGSGLAIASEAYVMLRRQL